MKRNCVGLFGQVLLLASCFFSAVVIAQKNTWTWIGGDAYHANSPVYEKVNGGPEVGPGAREGMATACYGSKVYVWGGITSNMGFDANYYTRMHVTNSYRDDYWELDLTTNKWTLLGGTIANLIPPTPYQSDYEKLSPRYGATLWATESRLFLFGGRANVGSMGYYEGDFQDDGGCYAERSDLWSFDITAKSWSKLKVNNSGGDVYNGGVYGTKGVAVNINTPGARKWAAGWTLGGKLYLFGGETKGTYFNDLWEFDPATGMWRWLTGSNAPGAAGIYGILGVSNNTNTPGARMQAAIGGSGNKLWLFGGYGNGENGKGYLNDLWEYDITTNEWKWLSGDKTPDINGVYGTMGISNAANKPGGRTSANLWWVDGSLWIGLGNGKAESTAGLLNDLWNFKTASGQWTWIKGSKAAGTPGYYPAIGQTTSLANPGARWQAGGWVMNGQIGCLGGIAVDSSGLQGRIYDIWTFNPVSGNWTWQQGNSNIDSNYYKRGRYGTKGIADASNRPGARHSAMTWQANGRFYLMGGEGSDRNGNFGLLNDLWEYNPESKWWKWVAGADVINDAPVYGVKGVINNSNKPGPRTNAATWSARGKLYLMGGFGNDKRQQTGVLNDLWAYDLITAQWVWLNGVDTINANGIYGQRGVSNPNNSPKARQRSGQWYLNGKCYLFGGATYDSWLNDLWEYDLASNQWRWLTGMDTSYSPPWRTDPHSFIVNQKLLLTGGYINKYDNSPYGSQIDDQWLFDPATGVWQKTGNGVSGYWANNLDHNGAYRSLSTNWSLPNATFLFGGKAYSYWTQSVACCLEVFNLTGLFQELNGGIIAGEKVNDKYLAGSTNINVKGVYPSSINPGNNPWPGARRDAVGWSLPGQLYLFGGYGMDASRMYGTLNDLWVYNLTDSVKPSDTAGSRFINDIHAEPNMATNPYNIVATIMPSGAQPVAGGVYIRLWIDATEQRANGKVYSRRHFEFQPAENAANATATVTLYFTQAEFDSFNTAGVSRKLPANPNDALGKSNLRISKTAGFSADGTGAFGSYSGTEKVIDPDDNRIAWNSMHGRWEVSFETVGFSGFFLHTYETGLPVNYTYLQGTATYQGIALQWACEASEALTQHLERSTDGNRFEPLTELSYTPAALRNFTYLDPAETLPLSNLLWYRIRQQLASGRLHYSNTIMIKVPEAAKPVWLLNNPVQDFATLQIHSKTKATASIRVMDATGRLLLNKQQQIMNGLNTVRLETNTLANGVYYMQVRLGDINHFTSFLKQ